MVTRALKGLTAGHYTFDPTKASVPFINAIGRGPLLDYHASRGALSLNLLAVGAPTCVCSTGIEGYISSDMNPGKQKFSKNCAKEPVGDLVAKHNPTCTIDQCKDPPPARPPAAPFPLPLLALPVPAPASAVADRRPGAPGDVSPSVC